LGADKAYDTHGFVDEMRILRITPHVAQNRSRKGGSAIDGRTTRHPGYVISQRIRKHIEEPFGGAKQIGGLRQTKQRGFSLRASGRLAMFFRSLSGGGHSFDVNIPKRLLRNPEIVLHLLVQPAFSGSSKCLGQANRHLGTHSRAAVQDRGQRLAADPKPLGGISDRNA
jgi:hypothetical protein